MKLRPFSTWRQENKELLVFLAIAFALPFLWFLVPAIFSLTGNSLHSLSSFSLFNVLCPAAGAMVVSLVYRAEDPLLPRTFFRRFLGLTAIVGLWALCGLFLPVLPSYSMLSSQASKEGLEMRTYLPTRTVLNKDFRQRT